MNKTKPNQIKSPDPKNLRFSVSLDSADLIYIYYLPCHSKFPMFTQLTMSSGKARRIFFAMFFQESPQVIILFIWDLCFCLFSLWILNQISFLKQNEDVLPVSHRRSSKTLKRKKPFKIEGTVVTKSEPKARSSWFSCVSNFLHKKFRSTSK